MLFRPLITALQAALPTAFRLDGGGAWNWGAASVEPPHRPVGEEAVAFAAPRVAQEAATHLLDLLPPQTREIAVLTHAEGLGASAVAARLGMSVRTVEYHLCEALLACRRSVETVSGGDECEERASAPNPEDPQRGDEGALCGRRCSDTERWCAVPDALVRQAADWRSRLHGRSVSYGERQAFEDWRRQSLVHRQAWQVIEVLYARLQGPAQGLYRRDQQLRAAQAARQRRRRWIWAVAVGSAVLCVFGLSGIGPLPR